MPFRCLFLSLLVSIVVAPAAEASIADQVLPFKDAGDGVEAVMGKRTPVLRFGPGAAKLYRGLAGRKVSVGCGRPGISNSTTNADGSVTVSGGGSFDPNTGLHELHGGGYAGTDMRLPRSGARVRLPFTGAPYDVCFIATPARRSDSDCLDPSFLDQQATCVRVLVALTDAGRAQVDYRARMINLDAIVDYVGWAQDPARRLAEVTRTAGLDVVALDAPDAAPAPDKTGVYLNGTTRVVAITLLDGTRKYVRWDGDVYSTNVTEFAGSSEESLRLP
ncbi:hypothetical protein OJ997_31210 [Solirubrobacter phytolaccae]|uniref:Uncharacterized protein n=1 Tax=Solirubrobacter phytolaccae TaxID=1404360 RepID=A0A9X3NE73_9ACTN|nr:hypothetical protein [Solirubrobacter phytolaccae]MDA0184813.1 hypothetical protein [Solirubrobacter phytolaccae]